MQLQFVAWRLFDSGSGIRDPDLYYQGKIGMEQAKSAIQYWISSGNLVMFDSWGS